MAFNEREHVYNVADIAARDALANVPVSSVAIIADIGGGIKGISFHDMDNWLPPVPFSFFAGDFSSGYKWLSGELVHLQDLDLAMSPSAFMIDGIVYTAPYTEFTLSAADVTHPRIDVVVGNTNGTITVIEGTPAADPIKPDIDTSTQIEKTFILIAAGATEPDGIASGDIYRENAGDPTEWDGSASISGVSVDFADASDPYEDTVATLATLLINGDSITYTTLTPVSTAAIDVVHFRIKPTFAWPNAKRIRFAFFNGNTQASDWIDVRDNNWTGFDSSNAAYQLIAAPSSVLNFTEPQVTRLRFIVQGGGADISFFLDNIIYQGGLTPSLVDLFSITDGVNTQDIDPGDLVTLASSNSSVNFDLSTPGTIDLTADTLYAIDGSISEQRDVNVQNFFLNVFGPANSSGIVLRGHATSSANPTTRALVGQHDADGIALQSMASGAGTSAVVRSLQVVKTSGGVAQIGIGSGISFNVKDLSGGYPIQGAIDLALTGVGSGAASSRMDFLTKNGGTLAVKLSVMPDGQLLFSQYTGGNFQAAATALLGVDGSGNVVRANNTPTLAATIYTANGALLTPRTVTHGANLLTLTGTNEVLFVQKTGSNTDNVAVFVGLGDCNTVHITGSGGAAPLYVRQNDGAGAAQQVDAIRANTTGLRDVVSYNALVTTSGSTNGIGCSMRYRAENSGGSTADMGYVDVVMTTVAAGSEVGEYRIRLRDGAGSSPARFVIAGANGQVTLSGYGAGGATVVTPTEMSVFDASGVMGGYALDPYADDTAAGVGGVSVGGLYWNTTSSAIHARLS